jgi:hypothetical protein
MRTTRFMTSYNILPSSFFHIRQMLPQWVERSVSSFVISTRKSRRSKCSKGSSLQYHETQKRLRLSIDVY